MPVPVRTEPLPDMFNNLHTDLGVSPMPATLAASVSASAGGESLDGTIIPENFPFPAGATWDLSSDKRTDATLVVRGVTPAAAVEYYRQAMPTAGYAFFQQSISQDRTKITYTGHSQSVEVVADTSVLIIFTQCTSAVQGEAVPSRRSDRVACA
ncbi:hypothetical protein [Pseudofrankia asymbiotica]|uniref:hypothetical protein n=1 Tax=Pseudofrankia asymbiotica TaxID=1834516 RepID=UPI001F526F53|nr:hypothetical protein [Pseudofrankia asymbiotica]